MCETHSVVVSIDSAVFLLPSCGCVFMCVSTATMQVCVCVREVYTLVVSPDACFIFMQVHVRACARARVRVYKCVCMSV